MTQPPNGGPANPTGGQPPRDEPTQPIPAQTSPEHPVPGTPYPSQPVSGTPYPRQPGSGQPYPGQPMPGQPYPGQPVPGEPFPAAAEFGQPGFGPPGYPPPPGYPAPPKKKRGLLIASIVLAVTLVLCGGGGLAAFLLLSNAETGDGAAEPTAAVDTFLKAVYIDKDAKKATALVCAEARKEADITKKVDEVKKYSTTYKGPRFAWNAPKVDEQNEERAIVSVQLTMTTGDEKTADQHLKFTVVQKTGWWVCEVA